MTSRAPARHRRPSPRKAARATTAPEPAPDEAADGYQPPPALAPPDPAEQRPMPGPPTADQSTAGPADADRTRGKRGGLLRKTSLAFTIQTAGALLNFVMNSGLAKALGAVLFGEYSYAFNLAQLVASPADLGASSSVTRLLPQYRVRGERAQLRGLIRVAQLTPIVVGSLAAGITAGVVALVGAGSAPLALMFVAIASMPAFVLTTVQTYLLRAMGSIVLAFGPLLVLQPLIILVYVVVAPHASVLTFAWVTIASLLIVTAIQSRCLHSKIRDLRSVRRAYPLRDWLKVSIPLLIISMVQLAFSRLDIVAVGLLLDAKSAGIYAIANRLAVAAASLQKALVTVVAPSMSGLHWSGRSAEVENLVLRGLRLVIGPATIVTIILAVGGTQILGLISHEYRAGYLALVVYALGQLFSVAAGPVGWLATIIDEQRAMARITIYSALIAIVLYATLIPTIGIVGAAAGNAIGIIYRNIAATRLVRKHGFRISVLRAVQTKGSVRRRRP